MNTILKQPGGAVVAQLRAAWLTMALLLTATGLSAQTDELLPAGHLRFEGVEMGQPRELFVRQLLGKRYALVESISTGDAQQWLQGRYDSFHCLLEIGASGPQEPVDSVTVWFQNVNNPVGNYRILRGFYTKRYGPPVADNFYDVSELGYATKEEQLAADSYATLFSLDEGTVTMRLSYDIYEKTFRYSLLFVDRQKTEHAAEQISDNSNHIDEEW